MRNYIVKYSLTVMFACCLIRLKAQQLPAQREPETMTLTQIWQQAEVNSKRLHISLLELNKSEQGIQDALAARLPELSADANAEKASDLPIYTDGLLGDVVQHNVVHTRYKMGVDGYLNIYNGNKVNYKVREQQALAQIAGEKHKQDISSIKLQAVTGYLDLQMGYMFRELIVSDINDQQLQFKRIKYNYDQGMVLKSDILRAQLKLSHEKLSLTTINNNIAIASQKLDIMIGAPDTHLIRPASNMTPDSLEIKSYEGYIAEALGKSYDRHIAKGIISLSDIQHSMVKANTSLKLGLYANFTYANPETFLYPYYLHPYSLGIVGLKASFPISAFYLNKHKEKAAAIEAEQAAIRASDIEDKLRVQVNTAYLRFKEAMEKVEEARLNVSQAMENQRIVRNTYFNQTALLTDLLDADVQLLQSKLDLVTAQITALLQFYQLQDITGNL